MRFAKILQMDVVADTGPITRGVVGPENMYGRRTLYTAQNDWNKIGFSSLIVFDRSLG